MKPRSSSSAKSCELTPTNNILSDSLINGLAVLIRQVIVRVIVKAPRGCDLRMVIINRIFSGLQKYPAREILDVF